MKKNAWTIRYKKTGKAIGPCFPFTANVMRNHESRTETKNMTRIILPILLICGICGLIAQETGSHFKEQHIRIGTGFSKFILQDDIVSLMVYKGLTIPIWLDYKEVTHKYINNLSAFFSKLDLKSDIPGDFSNHHSEIITGCLGYSLLRKIYTSKSVRTSAYAGGKWETFINYREHYYARYSNEIVADLNSSLDIQFTLVNKFDKIIDKISYSLNSPLITFAASPNLVQYQSDREKLWDCFSCKAF